MGLLQSLSGTLSVTITSADPSRTLAGLNELGIKIYHAKHTDPFTVSAEFAQKDYKKAATWVEKKGGQIQINHRNGLYWGLAAVLRRPVFLLGLLLILTLTVALPRMVLFVYVEGNEKLPDRMILEKAGECGIVFGASRQEVRSEKMKNALLGKLPQLEWAGINTAGCVAIITVQERSQGEQELVPPTVSSIVAARDGIIVDVTATKGNLVCKVGQAVKAGQTLVSGYTDCGIKIKAEAAKGEIYAQTMRELSVSILEEGQRKLQVQSRSTSYTLVIGGRMIPVFSGKSPHDPQNLLVSKTTKQLNLTLFGGFIMPVSLLVEEYAFFEADATTMENQEGILSQYARDYLLTQMISGRIIGTESCMQDSEISNAMKYTFFCIEMIGVDRVETDFTNIKQG